MIHIFKVYVFQKRFQRKAMIHHLLKINGNLKKVMKEGLSALIIELKCHTILLMS
jgi:stress-induced morphogen